MRAGKPNALLSQQELLRDCALPAAEQKMLEMAAEKLQLSARALHRILRVARTIADLGGCASIERAHLAEAIGYRGSIAHV